MEEERKEGMKGEVKGGERKRKNEGGKEGMKGEEKEVKGGERRNGGRKEE